MHFPLSSSTSKSWTAAGGPLTTMADGTITLVWVVGMTTCMAAPTVILARRTPRSCGTSSAGSDWPTTSASSTPSGRALSQVVVQGTRLRRDLRVGRPQQALRLAPALAGDRGSEPHPCSVASCLPDPLRFHCASWLRASQTLYVRARFTRRRALASFCFSCHFGRLVVSPSWSVPRHLNTIKYKNLE